jgi:hypothetical protein
MGRALGLPTIYNLPTVYGPAFYFKLAVVDCGTLTDPANGSVSLSGTTFGSQAFYTCEDGHGFPESSSDLVTRECLVSGWSGLEPTCERKLS